MGKWTRRGLIGVGVAGAGALAVGVWVQPGNRGALVKDLVAGDGESMLGAYVMIDADNKVTAIVPHSEMGQGAQTALAQMLADELGANWSDVSFREAPATAEYANYALGKGFLVGDADVPAALVPTLDGTFMKIAELMNLQITGGSLSVRATGQYGMRVAGAAARELLLEAAANAWDVDVASLSARDGQISHAATARSAPFAEFATAAAALTPSRTPKLKTRAEFTIMGTSVARLDIPEKVTGEAMFGIDADVAGAKVATIQAAPVFGATLKSSDSTRAAKMPGVHTVVELPDAVAVVADGYWQAKQALAAVKTEWTRTEHDGIASDGIYAQFDRDMASAVENGEEQTDVSVGDARTALAGADQVIEATYRVPYLAHSCMEPMNATVAVGDDGAEIWLGTQNPLGTRAAIASALDLDVDQVQVHNHVMGGGFGRRATDDCAVQAALIAKEAGVPVKLIWSREEDVRHDHYRPAVTSRFAATLASDGTVDAWENQYVDKHEPAEAPHIPYAVANQFIHYADSPTHVPFGAWRSVDHSQHGFFTESFVDELAHAAGEDPLAFRLRMLADKPRHRAVLEKAAAAANWDQARPAGSGRGIALQESFGSIVAEVADIRMVDGKVKVDRVVCAVDPGFAVSPDGLAAQMESGIVYGLTAALYGNIEISDGAVRQSNFHDYPALRMDEMPTVEVHIVESDNAPGGAGEPGTPAIAPAVANAVFDATGTRVRTLPFDQFDFDFRVREDAEII